MEYLTVSLLLLALWLLVIRLRQRLPYRVWSPVYLALVVYLVVGFGGLWLYGFAHIAEGTFYWLPVSRADLVWTLARVVALLCVMCIGSLVYVGLTRSTEPNTSRGPQTATPPHATHLTAGSMWLVLALTLLPFVPLLLGVGAGNIWSSSIYLAQEDRTMKIVGLALALAGVFGSGVLFGSGARGRQGALRVIGVLVFIAYELVFIGLATRQLALAPVVFFAGALLVRRHSKWLQALVGLSVLASPLLLQIPLTMRVQPKLGLSPFLTNVASTSGEFLRQMVNVGNMEAFALNVFYGLPLTAYVSTAKSIPLSYLLVSVNPLPGSMTSWYTIGNELRVNPYIPFSAVGELLNYGMLLAIAFFFVLGVIFAAVDSSVRRHVDRGLYFLPSIYIGLCSLFIIMSTQYNLRAAVRLLFYLLVVAIGARLLALLRPKSVRTSQVIGSDSKCDPTGGP